jgi:hypothetical protein
MGIGEEGITIVEILLEVAKNYGPSGVYLVFVTVLWRQLLAANAKYEALAERAITSLTLLAKELEDINDAREKDHEVDRPGHDAA